MKEHRPGSLHTVIRGKLIAVHHIFTLISKRDVKSYELAIVELNERISRIINESELLNNAISKIESFGTDYNQMTEEQQYELGSYIRLI